MISIRSFFFQIEVFHRADFGCRSLLEDPLLTFRIRVSVSILSACTAYEAALSTPHNGVDALYAAATANLPRPGDFIRPRSYALGTKPHEVQAIIAASID